MAKWIWRSFPVGNSITNIRIFNAFTGSRIGNPYEKDNVADIEPAAAAPEEIPLISAQIENQVNRVCRLDAGMKNTRTPAAGQRFAAGFACREQPAVPTGSYASRGGACEAISE